jgi:ribosome-associated protein
MISEDSHWRIPLTELQWSFVRAGGPGGQNVNKVASKAVLRWNVRASRSLSEEIKARFLKQQHGRVTAAGEFLITSQRFRDQERNKQDCLEKLEHFLRQAAVRPIPRRPTRPTRTAKENRLMSKKRRSHLKAGRQSPSGE